MNEQLSPETLTAVFREHLGPDARCTALSRTPLGNSQETYFVTISGVDGASELVLRRSAAGGTLEWSDRGTEVTVLNAARSAGLPVPKVWWWEPDGSSLERAYTVMDRSPGSNPDLRDNGVCTTLAADLGRWIARLHLDVTPPADIDWPATATVASQEQLDWWVDRARSTSITPEVTGALCGWLAANIPDDGIEPVLLWGDPGPHNVLTDQTGAVTALLDWELTHVGHPMFDLGAARWSCLGHLDREVLTRAYESELGAPVNRDVLRWFEVLACVSRSVMLFDGMTAVLEGRAHDPNVIALGQALVNANMLRAATIAWGLDVRPFADADGAILADPYHTAVGRFLIDDVLEDISNSRVRRGVKIAAALIATPPALPSVGQDPWGCYELESTGRATTENQHRWTAQLMADRGRLAPLIRLYGKTVAAE
jgi:aminoglycoside phosphotransferase (APT) family kinase protein